MSCNTNTQVRGHARSSDLSPIDRPYTSFYRHSLVTSSRPLRFRDIAGFVSQMSLLCIPPRLSPKIWSSGVTTDLVPTAKHSHRAPSQRSNFMEMESLCVCHINRLTTGDIITACTAVQAVVKLTAKVMVMAKFRPPWLQNPERISMKLRIGDLHRVS